MKSVFWTKRGQKIQEGGLPPPPYVMLFFNAPPPHSKTVRKSSVAQTVPKIFKFAAKNVTGLFSATVRPTGPCCMFLESGDQGLSFGRGVEGLRAKKKFFCLRKNFFKGAIQCKI